MRFSVLMSLYAKERPEYLRQSLESVFGQTIKGDEVILVEDGPLTPLLDAVVEEFNRAHPELKVVSFPKNRGLGLALHDGLEQCSNDIVVRMDTDDIAKPDRFEKQLAYMESHPEVSVIGCWMDEFYESTDNVLSIKKTPESSEEIAEYAKGRNPMNHPSVMFRKKDVEAVGSYQHFPMFEDYLLWAKMIVKGYKMHNLQESLMWFRSSPDVYKRRGGWKYACDEARFQKELNSLGLITSLLTYKNIIIRFVVRIMPNKLRKIIYSQLLREKHQEITPPTCVINWCTPVYKLRELTLRLAS